MKQNNAKKWNLTTFVSTAMLAAVAGVLMSMEISIPFMPPFYKLDISDVPTIVGLFTFGPLSAAVIEIVKVLIKLITVGTNSAYVGEFANLLGIALFIGPVWFTYKALHFSKHALKLSLLLSIPIRIFFSCCVNAFITLPLYAAAMNIDINAVVQAVGSVNPFIKDLPTFIVLATIPFNLLKNTVNCMLGYLLFEKLIKGHAISLIRITPIEKEEDLKKSA